MLSVGTWGQLACFTSYIRMHTVALPLRNVGGRLPLRVAAYMARVMPLEKKHVR
jgi:hypothetical protein